MGRFGSRRGGGSALRLPAGPKRPDQPAQVRTCTTELSVPCALNTCSEAFGSGSHCPSTTNLYSWRPGGKARLASQSPPFCRFMGVASGDQALNPPQSDTRWAWGSKSAKPTLTVWAAFGDGTAASGTDDAEDGVPVVVRALPPGEGTDGLAAASTADVGFRGRARGLSGLGSTGLATVTTAASGLLDLVLFCILGLRSVCVSIKGGRC